MGKTPPKTLLTCGASYKPPALPADIYVASVALLCCPKLMQGISKIQSVLSDAPEAKISPSHAIRLAPLGDSILLRTRLRAIASTAHDPPPQRSASSVPQNHGKIMTAAQRFHTTRIKNGGRGLAARCLPLGERTSLDCLRMSESPITDVETRGSTTRFPERKLT